MTNSTLFLLTLATASLLACGKSEQPAALPPAQDMTQQAEPAPPAEAAAALTEAPPATAAVAPSSAAAPSPAPASVTADAAPASAPASAGPDLARGQQIYRQACAFCHDKGIAGAPKVGDAAAWGARVAQGMNTLYASALHGKNTMPAKGGNPALADADVTAAVDFMVAQSR